MPRNLSPGGGHPLRRFLTFRLRTLPAAVVARSAPSMGGSIEESKVEEFRNRVRQAAIRRLLGAGYSTLITYSPLTNFPNRSNASSHGAGA